MAIQRRNLADNLEVIGVYSSAANFLTGIGESSASEGMVYYDTTDNVLKAYNGSSWVAQGSVSNTVGFPAALAVNPKGTVQAEIELADEANTSCLVLDQNDSTNDPVALQIENAGTGNCIDIDGQSGGNDICGTGDNWTVSGTGVGTFSGLKLNDGENLTLGTGNDVTLNFSGTQLLMEAASDNDFQFRIGSTNAMDVAIYGSTNTNIALFDCNTAILEMNGWDINLQDSDVLKLGDADDITIQWDGSDCLIDGAAADTVIKIGATNNQNVVIYGETATNYFQFDTDDSALTMDFVNTGIDMTDGSTTFSIGPVSSNNLPIDGNAANKTITLGANNATDLVLSGASYDLTWDASADALIFADGSSAEFGTGSDLTIGATGTTATATIASGSSLALAAAGASAAFAIGGASNVVNITQHGTLTLGVDDTGYDVKFFGATSGAYMLWDESADDLILAGAAGLSVAGTSTLTGAVTCTAGVQAASVAVTATDDGTGTGTIPDGTTFATVDADGDANHIVVLPTPTPGNIVYIAEDGTTGYELRSSAPGTVAINGGTGATAESAIAGAITYIRCVCVSATSWICSQFDADGDESKVAAAG